MEDEQQLPLQTTTQRPPSPIIVARILTMVLENGTALALRRAKPYIVATLNRLRTLLLQDPFFDQQHRTDELAGRTRPAKVLFMDLVVLLARLMRVLMRREPLDEEATAERITVRNACLDQPFFDRGRENSARPFVDDELEDEAVEV